LGDGTTTQRLTPVNVSGPVNGITAITGGNYHTCALTNTGGARCWGDNYFGELGDGTTTNRLTPINVSGLTSGVTAITGGNFHTCAITSVAGAKCWGDNYNGQLGDGTAGTSFHPVAVIGLTSGVKAISTGSVHTCAVTNIGGAKCWGYNGDGELGDGTMTIRLVPVNVNGLTSSAAAISAGGKHTCVLTSAGGIKCWGRNAFGQLGDGTTTNRLTPVDVSGLTNGVTAIAVGSVHTCALTSTGGVKCWGWNSNGQLGDGTTTQRLTPVDVSGLTSGVTAIATINDHNCALTSAGGVKCWGWNSGGQLGDGTTTQRLTPVDVSGLTSGVIAIAAGGSHTCALTSAGGVKCWGWNSSGQLGDGTTTIRLTPVNVIGLTSGVTAIATGNGHTCALTSTGSAKCWGGNDFGQLGDGTTTDRFTPVNVSGLTSNVGAIAAGGYHTCALTSAGSAKCWGGNDFGQLGDGNPIFRTTPVDVVGLGIVVVADSTRSTMTAAPTFIEANGIDASVITVTLKNASASPLAGKMVQIVSQRGPLDFINQPTAQTDASGIAMAELRSLTAGSSIIYAYVLGDGVRLSTSVTITFGPATPSFDPIRAQATRSVNLTQSTLDAIWNDSQAIVNEAIYFRTAVVENVFKWATDLVGGLADYFGGVADFSKGLPASQIVLPGWQSKLNSPAWASEAVCKISNAFLKDTTNLTGDETGQHLVRIVLRWGLYLLAAQKENKCLHDLQEDTLTDGATLSSLIIGHLEHSIADWPIKKNLDDLHAGLTAQLDRLNTVRLPPLSQSEIDAYVADLTARSNALSVYNDRVQDGRWTLESVHAANEAGPWGGETLETILRLSIKGIMEYKYRAAGRILVASYLTALDTYLNNAAVSDTVLMVGLATNTLLGTVPQSSQAAFDTVTTGLDRIVNGHTPHTPKGSISNVQHSSEGSYWGNYSWAPWKEQASYSTLTIQNTGSETASFYAVSRYQAQLTRLGYSWAFLWMSATSTPITLAPGESHTVRIDYRNGSRGYSPVEHVQYLVPWGEIRASSINIDLLGFNDTGEFHLDHYRTEEWAPTRFTTSSAASNRPVSMSAMTIDEPIVVFSGGDQSRPYESGLLWVNNPFTVSVPVTVTQPVPPEMTPLNPGKGVFTNSQLVWADTVAPLASQMFSYTFSISATPGASITLPAATLVMFGPTNEILTDTADSLPFMLPWHISISRNTPNWIAPGSTVSVIVTATNYLTAPISGSFTLSITTPTGSPVFAGTQALSMTGSLSQTFSFLLPVTMTIGDYQAIGLLETQGATGVMFNDPFSVGAQPPRLMTAAAPIAGDGTIAPSSTLTFTVLVTNATNVTLTNVAISNTIPLDLSIIAGTITDGGVRIGDVVRWSIASIAPYTGRVLSYIVDIPANYVPKGQGRYLESVATLTSQESPQTVGRSISMLIIEPLRKVYLPLLLRNY
jgi:uncharacterized repeat protein (TIGR01451 family)